MQTSSSSPGNTNTTRQKFGCLAHCLEELERHYSSSSSSNSIQGKYYYYLYIYISSGSSSSRNSGSSSKGYGSLWSYGG